jgi:ribosomal protein S15P/S13E
MFNADDPLLACIVRFVLKPGRTDTADEDFLRLQIKTLRRYLLQFPADQQERRALDWVAQHAANYRRYWQRRTVSERTWSLRCDDCPIADRGTTEHCEIHEQWLYLLRRYMLGEIHSRDYVEHALAVLQQHKDALIRRRQLLKPDGPSNDDDGKRGNKKPKKPKPKDKQHGNKRETLGEAKKLTKRKRKKAKN